MSDQNPDGTPFVPKEAEAPAVKTVEVSRSPAQAELKAPAGGIELTPTYVRQGNEAVVIVKMLESINKNLAFLAQTIHLHLNPGVKDGRPKA